MLFTRSWPITGACWWWSISPSPPGALAVAVAQDMGITVDYLPGLSMRRIADLASLSRFLCKRFTGGVRIGRGMRW